MFTNDIALLESKGFKIHKHSDFRTQITHENPFVVESTDNNVEAFLLETDNVYSIVMSGYPIDGMLQENIQQHLTPLLHNINAKADTQTDADDSESLPSIVASLFGELEVGDTFSKDEDFSKKYKKVSESSCILDESEGNSIAAKFDLPTLNSLEVFVMEMDDQLLSSDQKQNIVDHMATGLSYDEFAEAVSMDFENISGFEAIDDDTASALIGELFKMYTSK